MSATLEDAARTPWVEVGIAKNYTPASEEDIERIRKITRELAELPHRYHAEKSSESICRDAEKKQRQHRPRTKCGR